jgi:hypothetical protein
MNIRSNFFECILARTPDKSVDAKFGCTLGSSRTLDDSISRADLE